jgi:hypothetical protein
MLKAIQIIAITLAGTLLVGTFVLIFAESRWVDPNPTSPRDYFLHGSTGTELMPLAVFQVLPTLFPEQFQPAGENAGDWIKQFGFVRGTPDANYGLPYGINVSHYRPKSGAPSPIAFVGFNCAVCHTANFERVGQLRGTVVLGMANPRLDLVAFGDAIRRSVLDENRLTISTIATTYKGLNHKSLSFGQRLAIRYWLRGARTTLKADLPMRGSPFSGSNLRNSAVMPSGPGRNQPMMETVRFLIHETPVPNGGASKIPCLYQQQRRLRAQFDGSVGDPLTRNSLAALGVGASVYNLKVPGILGTMQQSYIFVKTLDGPRYADLNGADAHAVDQARVQRGHDAYMQYCSSCHGWPEGENWTTGSRQGQVIPVSEVGTDSARVSFRYYADMGTFIDAFFPPGHPLKPPVGDIRALPEAERGFITEPLEAAFTRGPYLHNGSVPTLAELINLKPRRAVFYRGRSEFDPVEVGIVVTDQPDLDHYFRYDTSVYGNSNRGHNYPWPYQGTGWNADTLTDLLEYLKTL